MGWEAVVGWVVMVPLMIANGAARDFGLKRGLGLGDGVARAISCFTGSACIFLVGYIFVRWAGPLSAREAALTGLLWLALTVGFEFGFGRFGARKSWAELLADYNLRRGRLWVLILISVTAAPTFWNRQIWG